MVAIFSKLCLWPRSLCSNLGGIGPRKLYRATLRRDAYALVYRGLRLRRSPAQVHELCME